MLAVDRFAGVLWSTTARRALSSPLTYKHNLLLPLVAKSKLSQLKTDAFGLDSLDFLPGKEILPPTDLTDLHEYAEYVEDNTDNK